MEPKWLEWSKRLSALAQSGLTFSQNPFDIERYKEMRDLAAEMMAEGTGAPIEKILDLLKQDSGYATPKVDVRGVVFRDDTILLVQERSDGQWTLPGGFADVGDSPSEAVVREVVEESGYEVRATRLLAVLDRNRQGHPPFPHHLYKIFIECQLLGGAPATSIETTGVGFYKEDQLPPLSLTRTTPGQIARMFQHHREPGLPPDLD